MYAHTHKYLNARPFLELSVVVGLSPRVPQELEHGGKRLLHQNPVASDQRMGPAFRLLEAAHLNEESKHMYVSIHVVDVVVP